MRSLLAILVLLLLPACAVQSPRASGDILVIGDSVMAWNKASGRDIGSAIEAELGRDVTSRAVPGAGITSSGLGLLARPVSSQLGQGRWNWVVINGGANDLGALCGCSRCDSAVDRLISRDGRSGDIPRLIAAARATGARVLWMGYYKAPDTSLFRGCRPALVEIERRIARLAEAVPGVTFADAEDVMPPGRPDLLASDRTHPSPAGSALIGRYLARIIASG